MYIYECILFKFWYLLTNHNLPPQVNFVAKIKGILFNVVPEYLI